MQPRPVKLPELPEFGQGDMLFTLKDVFYTPELPRMKEPFTVRGKVELFGIPFLLPIWCIARVTYPEKFWEEIIPIWGSPSVGEGQTALGGDFEINFPRGFDREGEFLLDVEVHAGPTFTVDRVTIPPFPPVASQALTFVVGGEVPPEEVGFRTFRILSYSKNGGPPVTPPGVLELDIGDRCWVNVGFDHMDGEVTGKFHAAIWQKRIWDPHDEILNAEKVFTVPPSPDWQPFEDSIDIVITSAISPGTEYGLYVKIMGITGGDIFTEYLENVITIVGVPPEEKLNFSLTKPSPSIYRPDPGTQIELTCPVTSRCTMLVDAEARVIIYEGSIMPGHGTKITEYESSIPQINPDETVDVVIEHTTVAGTIDRRDVEVEVYVEGKKIKESEWDDVFYVTMPPELETLEVRIDPLGAGYVTTSPEPIGGVQHNWQFPYGTIVYVTAHPNTGYVFESWSGEMTDTSAITALVYPMTEHRLITAHFQLEEVPPPTTDIKNFDFQAQKGTYDMGERVSFTAPYEYKGKEQNGWLTISLGTGTYPAFFTRHTFSRVSITFEEAMDWQPRQMQGTFELPDTLVAGQTYNVRAKLETADGKKETDTDWGVFTIRALPPEEKLYLELASEPWIGGNIIDEPDKPYYSYGEIVKLTADPFSWIGYRFSHWTFDGEWMGTANPINLMMTRSSRVTAYFIK